uniref:Uncharacterized protein n=1 Tax=Arundo donax TaxID=35708 RepID=A0A0A9B8N4_ARUDO
MVARGCRRGRERC